MAITIGDISTGGQASGATLTFSHTVASGEVLYVCAGSGQEGTDIITGVTFNGDALTKAVDVDGGDATYTSIWYIDNPDVATGDVVISTSADGRGTGGIAISLGGANTSGSKGVTAGQYFASTDAFSLNINTGSDNSLIISSFSLNGTGRTITATGTDQTKQAEVIGECQHALSTQTTTTAGTYTNSYSTSSAQVGKIALVEVKASTGGGGVTNRFLSLLGVGT